MKYGFESQNSITLTLEVDDDITDTLGLLLSRSNKPKELCIDLMPGVHYAKLEKDLCALKETKCPEKITALWGAELTNIVPEEGCSNLRCNEGNIDFVLDTIERWAKGNQRNAHYHP